jgi:hypothetical protein
MAFFGTFSRKKPRDGAMRQSGGEQLFNTPAFGQDRTYFLCWLKCLEVLDKGCHSPLESLPILKCHATPTLTQLIFFEQKKSAGEAYTKDPEVLEIEPSFGYVDDTNFERSFVKFHASAADEHDLVWAISEIRLAIAAVMVWLSTDPQLRLLWNEEIFGAGM